MPLVSIIIPTFNKAQFIGETLDSLVAQTYTNWECIIVDDGSIDNTADVVMEYIKKDSRIKFYKRPEDYKKGASSCRNYSFELSKGKYIQYLDSDDVISGSKLEAQLEVLFQESNATCVICKWGIFDNDISKDNIRENLPYYKNINSPKEFFNILGEHGLYIPIHSYLIPRDLVVNAGKWNETLSINDDGEFFTRLLLRVDKILYVEKATVFYRKNNGFGLSSYSSEKLKKLKYSWQLIEKHLKPLYKKEEIKYVKNAKKRIFAQTKNAYPFFIIKNLYFFKDVIGILLIKKINNYFGL